MKINTKSDELEIDYYLQIIEYFQNEKISREEIEIWTDKSIIELMKYLKHTQNRTLVTNALILILSLFENTPPDNYNNRGLEINFGSEIDKQSILKNLKNEFLPN